MSEKQTKPKLTFTRDLNKITFLNQEAFQVMQEALENPSVLDEVEFELDDANEMSKNLFCHFSFRL